jgi:hypothetical protein
MNSTEAYKRSQYPSYATPSGTILSIPTSVWLVSKVCRGCGRALDSRWRPKVGNDFYRADRIGGAGGG